MRWIAYTLLALLGIAWLMLAFAAPQLEMRPAPDERGPTGLSALYEALQSQGYRIRFDGSVRPRLAASDVAVCPIRTESEPAFASDIVVEPVLNHLKQGGRAFLIAVPGEIETVSSPVKASGPGDVQARVTPVEPQNAELVMGEDLAHQRLWTVARDDDEDQVLAQAAAFGEGQAAVLEAGSLATNRFLGRADNARLVLSTLASIAHPGDQLVFVAGGYGEAQAEGPIEAIGPWAVGALWQGLILLALFGISRGVRFGLPEPVPVVRRGARELLDALAGHYQRGRRVDAALRAVVKERPGDADAQALALRQDVSERDALAALREIESRPKIRPR